MPLQADIIQARKSADKEIPVQKKKFALPGLMTSAFIEFRKNNPLQLAGATAFFTTFALPPILMILIQLFGLLFGRRFMGRNMIERLKHTLGDESALKIREVLLNIRHFADNWMVTIGGFVFLIFVATTLFTVIKSSLNQVWQIRVKSSARFKYGLAVRARSMGIIFIAGILFLAGVLMESVEIFLGDYLDKIWPGRGHFFVSALNEIVGAVIITAWFVVLFRFLANGRPSWRLSLVGGLVTGILYTMGALLLRYFLIRSNVGTFYGTSGSVILILLFVFYSSFILYYGACFIKVLSEYRNDPILTSPKAYHYEIKEVGRED